jgi:hypothetical protein
MPYAIQTMNKKIVVTITFCLACVLSTPLPGRAATAQPSNLASADWSLNSARNLASKPPPPADVQAFEHAAFGAANELGGDKVCEFRFADLRGSGNLSLIVTVNGGGTGGCNLVYIFDKTATGFELYSADGAVGDDLTKSVVDINHDGKNELVLWGYLAPTATNELGCEADWPLIFAWTGNEYAEVSSQYKRYYQGYLDSLKKRMATAKQSPAEEAQAPAVAAPEDAAPAISQHPRVEVSLGNMGGGFGQAGRVPSPVAIPEVAREAAPDSDYACQQIEAAKTEAFLNIHSDATMNTAIAGSESADSDTRILAAVIFSYIGSEEAKTDLKTLAGDADLRVRDIAKERISHGSDPGEDFRTMRREPAFAENRAPYYVKLTDHRQATASNEKKLSR